MNHFEVFTLKKDHITDFAAERNDLLQKAKKDWVLFIDSDEKISDTNLHISNKYSGYKIRRDNYFLKKFIGSDWIIRLGKKGAGKWVRRVHETWEINGKVGMLKEHLVHNTADSLSDYITKINYYSDLHALANKEEGKGSSLFKIFAYPIWKFIQTLFKSRNVVFSIMQSFHSFLSWSKLYFLHS
jgi:hypothetical protein